MDFRTLTDFIFDRIREYNLARHYAFAEMLYDKKSETNIPATYCENGDFKHVVNDYDWSEGICYIRLNGQQRSREDDSGNVVACEDMLITTIPLRLVLINKRSRYSPYDLAQVISSAVAGAYNTVQQEIGAVYVHAIASSVDSDIKQVLEDEFGDIEKIQWDTAYLAIACDIEIEVKGKAGCFNPCLGAQTNRAAAPVITPDAGTYAGFVMLTMSSSTTGARIYYTTDGTIPTSINGSLYDPDNKPIVNETTTIKAIGVKAGCTNSDVFEGVFAVPYKLWMASIRNASNGRIWQSTNNGVSWSELRPLGNNNRDWEGVGGFDSGAAIFAQLGSTLYRSADKGATWTSITSPNGNAFLSNSSKINNPNFPLLIQRGTSGVKMLMIGSNANPAQSNLFLSTNSGESFTAIPVPPCGNVWGACVLNNGWILACAVIIETFGVYRSKDDGASWEEVLAPISGRKASRLIAVGNEVYLPLTNLGDSPAGAYYSSNGGDSFSFLTWATNLELYQKANNNRMIAVRLQNYPDVSVTRYSDDNFATQPTEVDPISSRTTGLRGLAANSEGYVLVHDNYLLALSSDNGLTYTTIYPQGGTLTREWYGLAMIGE